MKIKALIPTLTGFEEIGIEQVSGKPLEEIVETGRNILLARVMGAVLIARSDKLALRAAWDKAQGLTQSELGELFTDDDDADDDVFEDDPDTEAGKGVSETMSVPTS